MDSTTTRSNRNQPSTPGGDAAVAVVLRPRALNGSSLVRARLSNSHFTFLLQLSSPSSSISTSLLSSLKRTKAAKAAALWPPSRKGNTDTDSPTPGNYSGAVGAWCAAESTTVFGGGRPTTAISPWLFPMQPPGFRYRRGEILAIVVLFIIYYYYYFYFSSSSRDEGSVGWLLPQFFSGVGSAGARGLALARALPAGFFLTSWRWCRRGAVAAPPRLASGPPPALVCFGALPPFCFWSRRHAGRGSRQLPLLYGGASGERGSGERPKRASAWLGRPACLLDGTHSACVRCDVRDPKCIR
jgi:hypothetical protein